MQVIPILVEGAASPEADQLPDELKPLARRNPLVLHDENWDEGLDRLARALSTASAPPRSVRPKAPASAAPGLGGLIKPVSGTW